MEQLALYLFAVPSLYAWLTLITLVIGRVLFSMIIRYLGTSVQFAPISELTQKVRSHAIRDNKLFLTKLMPKPT